ncbi:MAG: hypothetical protein VW547_05485 [Alphaproteobacteria bacterium]
MSDNKKHAPGPWEWDGEGLKDASRDPVIYTDGRTGVPYCDDEDAGLIEAAPDLLAACEAMIVRHAHPPTARCRECDAMRAAIAKARGTK